MYKIEARLDATLACLLVNPSPVSFVVHAVRRQSRLKWRVSRRSLHHRKAQVLHDTAVAVREARAPLASGGDLRRTRHDQFQLRNRNPRRRAHSALQIALSIIFFHVHVDHRPGFPPWAVMNHLTRRARSRASVPRLDPPPTTRAKLARVAKKPRPSRRHKFTFTCATGISFAFGVRSRRESNSRAQFFRNRKRFSSRRRQETNNEDEGARIRARLLALARGATRKKSFEPNRITSRDMRAFASTSMASHSSRVARAAARLWVPLRLTRDELALKHTLVTGQTFRWRAIGTSDVDYVGVIGARVVRVRERVGEAEYKVYCRPEGEDASDDARVVGDYFNANARLSAMHDDFARRDARFRGIQSHVRGARMLRQDPSECLFSFICSSNNHISRIAGMVEKMCEQYGEPLPVTRGDVMNDDDSTGEYRGRETSPQAMAEGDGKETFYAFPSVSRIVERASEERLRELGFGYRAKFIVGAAKVLVENAEGKTPEAYLASLRDEKSYAEAHEALMKCPGVGPKVSSCACLFSLDKHRAIPVDTHVWQFVVEHYMPELRDAKSLTPKIMRAVEDKMFEIYGEYAGWAHNALFIAELKPIKESLPEGLRTPKRQTPGSASRLKSAKKLKAEIKTEIKTEIDDDSPAPGDAFGSPRSTPPFETL